MKKNTKTAERMTTIRDLMHYWFDLCDLQLEWVPTAIVPPHEKKNASMVDWTHRFIVNGHRISEFYLISLLAAWMMTQGYGCNFIEVGVFLREWAIGRFATDVPPDIRDAVAQRFVIKMKRKRGRPRRTTPALEVVIETDGTIHPPADHITVKKGRKMGSGLGPELGQVGE